MIRCAILLFILTPSLQDFVNISSRARLVDPTHYIAKVMQETFSEIEDRGFCNLKLRDFNQTLNESMYNWHVVGHVEYTNGFLYQMDRIRVYSLSGSISTSSFTGVTASSFSASVELLPAVVGYDVMADLGSDGIHHFTGIFRHPHIRYNLWLSKNMHTNEITTTCILDSVGNGSGVRMVYMPESRVTEVLSRTFRASTFDSANDWCRNIILPIMTQKANEVEFPKMFFQ